MDQDGRWSLQRNPDYLSQETSLKRFIRKEKDERLIFDTSRMPHPLRTASSDEPVAVDVVFPVIHGTYGEDFLQILPVLRYYRNTWQMKSVWKSAQLLRQVKGYISMDTLRTWHD